MAVLLAGSVLSVMFGTLMYLQMSATARADQEIELEVAERLTAAGLSPTDPADDPPPGDELDPIPAAIPGENEPDDAPETAQSEDVDQVETLDVATADGIASGVDPDEPLNGLPPESTSEQGPSAADTQADQLTVETDAVPLATKTGATKTGAAATGAAEGS